MTSPTTTAPATTAPAAIAPRRRGRPSRGSTAVDEPSVLEAALELFAEQGYDGASVRELCRRLGVSHNLLHQRYGSKERLWFAAVDHGFHGLAEEFIDAALGIDDDLVALRRVMVRFLDVAAREPALLQIINQEATRAGPRLDHIVDAYLGPAVVMMEEICARLVAGGVFRPLPVPAIYVLVTHGAGGVVSLGPLADRLGLAPLRRDPESVHEFAETIVDVVIAGCRPRVGCAES